jgi:hypothetical protein
MCWTQVDLKKKLDRKNLQETAPALRLRVLRNCSGEVKEAGLARRSGFSRDGRPRAKERCSINFVQLSTPRGFRVEECRASLEKTSGSVLFSGLSGARTPANGRISPLFNRSWYRRVFWTTRLTESAFAPLAIVRGRFRRALSSERQLTQEGALLVKFFLLHISKKEQRKRLKALEADEATSGASRMRIGSWHRTLRRDGGVFGVNVLLPHRSCGRLPGTLV